MTDAGKLEYGPGSGLVWFRLGWESPDLICGPGGSTATDVSLLRTPTGRWTRLGPVLTPWKPAHAKRYRHR